MEKWLKERLSLCLDFPIPDEMIGFVLSMKTAEEIDEYFQTLLSYELPEHRLFINDFKQRVFSKNNQPGTIGNTGPLNRRNKGKQTAGPAGVPKKVDSALAQTAPKETPPATKKKTKYVNLYTEDGRMNDTVLLKGRHHCDCQAARHKLISNCMKCGRIICEQEGSGPCLFCGNLVCSEEERKLIKSTTKKGEHLKKSLMDQNRPKGWEEALAQRNRLLEYDRTSERRTTVIDDESDYFKENSVWLSDSERKKLDRLEEEMRDKKHASRLNKKVTIDFSGRQCVEEPQITLEYEDKILKEIAKSCSDNVYGNTRRKSDEPYEISDDVHPGVEGLSPVFSEINPGGRKGHTPDAGFDGVYDRVQDKELLEVSDRSHCLSMHQPWASLLIAGIKQGEGRTWYSSHRGRLWIAATSKPVKIEEVRVIEKFYRLIYKNENILFPSQYPTGCLLGCVSVQDCLPFEVYKKRYPDGEVDSPFVFMCTDPQELPIRFPMRGEHKIYKLDAKIHIAAVKSLQRLSKLKAGQE